jgi:hypothetical protein
MKKRQPLRKSAVTSHLPPAFSRRSWIWHLVPRHRIAGRGGCRGFKGPVPPPLSIRLTVKIARRRQVVKRFSCLITLRGPLDTRLANAENGPQMPAGWAQSYRECFFKDSRRRGLPLLLPPFERGSRRQEVHRTCDVPVCQSQPANALLSCHFVGNTCARQAVRQRVRAVRLCQIDPEDTRGVSGSRRKILFGGQFRLEGRRRGLRS